MSSPGQREEKLGQAGLSRGQEDRLLAGETVTDYGDDYAGGFGIQAQAVGAVRSANGSKLNVTLGGRFKDEERFLSMDDLLERASNLSSDVLHGEAMRTNDEYSANEMMRLQAHMQPTTSDPLTFASSFIAGQGLKAPSDGFWRGLSGDARTSVLDTPASFGENLGLTLNGMVTGPVRAAHGLASEIGGQYQDIYNLLTRDGASYVPSSALASSVQRQGVGSTLLSMGHGLASVPSQPVIDLLEGRYVQAGTGLPGTVAAGFGLTRSISGLRLRTENIGAKLSFDSSLNVVDRTWGVKAGEILSENPVARSSYARLQRQGTEVRFVNDPEMNQMGIFDANRNTVTVNMLRHSSADEVASTVVHEAVHQNRFFERGVSPGTQYEEYLAFRNEFLFTNGRRPTVLERQQIINDVVKPLYPRLPSGRLPTFGG